MKICRKFGTHGGRTPSYQDSYKTGLPPFSILHLLPITSIPHTLCTCAYLVHHTNDWHCSFGFAAASFLSSSSAFVNLAISSNLSSFLWRPLCTVLAESMSRFVPTTPRQPVRQLHATDTANVRPCTSVFPQEWVSACLCSHFYCRIPPPLSVSPLRLLYAHESLRPVLLPRVSSISIPSGGAVS